MVGRERESAVHTEDGESVIADWQPWWPGRTRPQKPGVPRPITESAALERRRGADDEEE